MRSLFLILTTVFAGCATARFEPRAADGFIERIDEGRRYFVYRPAGWTPEKKWPVILYLHGAAERGNDGVRPTQAGLGPHVWQTHGAFPYVVLFPQAPPDSFWAFPVEEKRVMHILERSMREDSGDPTRVYLTGNSMGGFGTWIIGAQHTDVFAALVPICGGVQPPRGKPLPPNAPFAHAPDPFMAVAQAIGMTPVWAFHGARDWLVEPWQTQRMVEDLHKLGNPAKMTIYPTLGHNSWDRTYADPSLWSWLSEQHK